MAQLTLDELIDLRGLYARRPIAAYAPQTVQHRDRQIRALIDEIMSYRAAGEEARSE